jgi:hypothetical protein
VVEFKREVYQLALNELARFLRGPSPDRQRPEAEIR